MEYQDVRASIRRGLHHRQKELETLEANTTQVRHFLPALITGLLQTPEYLRQALSSPVDPAVSADRSRSMAVKLQRQSILHNQTKRFDFLLTESAVRWQLCEPLVTDATGYRFRPACLLWTVLSLLASHHAR